MSKTYVDNAYNRSVGRVGMEHGSMVISRSSSGGGSSFGGGGVSSGAQGSSGGGVSSSFGTSSPTTYVDNSYNRSVGRVGMEHGSMVISRSSSGGGSSFGGGGVSSGAHGFSGGGVSSSLGTSSPKTYVDNSYNRSVGRVGMEHGSMVISSSSGGGSSFGGGSVSSGAHGFSGGGVSSSFGTSSPKTYVNNSYNRSVGRVGMEHGSMVISRSSSGGGSSFGGGGVSSGAHGSSGGVVSSSFATSSPKTYVDNAFNRSVGRVGMEHGSMVISRGSSSGGRISHGRETSGSTSRHSTGGDTTKVYVDNDYNRRHGRVGMEKGSMVISKKDTSRSIDTDRDSGIGTSLISSTDTEKVYKDNRFNRKLGRVGKPKGTAKHPSRESKSESGASKQDKVYVDNYLNRSLGRVGKPRGSMPFSRKSKQVQDAQEIMRHYNNDTYDEGYEEEYDPDPFSLELALSQINRKLEEITWAQEQNENKPPKTKAEILEEYSGVVIEFEDIELGRKIGQGGFGDVYFAQWKGTVVAVKMLRLQRVSKRRLHAFMNEIAIFCFLDDPSIVKFIGACTKTPNISIVMEYMPMSLFDALHMNEEIDFSEEERLQILRQTCSGLYYLHEQGIVHCDLKSQNVLLDYVSGETCIAKITDFGLSMIKADTETSVSCSEEHVRNVGTPRYSAPEVLRGERLSARDMMRADAYSLSLIIYEVIYEEEPFYDFTYAQLRKHVGEKGALPDVPVDIKIDGAIEEMIRSCWSFNPRKRPIVEEINNFFEMQQTIYVK
ncbi:hypothetical protein ACJMK2_030286 [Sinanodonta woodiana]|uniref:Protein kinase domain-containing protein n=1 Tax=Sinanodonta woodiana TaxID=1069815 RepID=A0ABD3XGE6_SINWO